MTRIYPDDLESCHAGLEPASISTAPVRIDPGEARGDIIEPWNGLRVEPAMTMSMYRAAIARSPLSGPHAVGDDGFIRKQ